MFIGMVAFAQSPGDDRWPDSFAQAEGIRPDVTGAIVVTDPRQKALAMTESMQVMGQILDDNLEDLFQPQMDLQTYLYPGLSAGLKPSTPGKIQSPHVVYLDGYGVVYQLETPPLYQVVEVPAVQSPAPRKPLSVWEKARRRLRGEEVEEEVRVEIKWQIAEIPSAAPTKDQLVEKLLALLAENGHNFENLAADDRLTVAITFRKAAPSTTAKSKTSRQGYWWYGGSKPGASVAKVAQPESLPAHLTPLQLDTRTGGLAVGKLTHELTGDLHLRQGDYKKAIEAYEQALPKPSSTESLYGQIKFSPEGLSKENRRLMQKLSQAQIGAGNFDKAQKLLENLSRAEATARLASNSTKRDNKSSPSSAQLVVSVKKSDLDAVAAGKLPRGKFNKQASVRYFDPTTVRRKPEGK
jgi:tetratricopeptide (TPR) repeat protein